MSNRYERQGIPDSTYKSANQGQVGVGYTQGVPDIVDEVGLGQEFIGFYKQFVQTFDLYRWKVYLTGESYAGYYVPYIADAFIQQDDCVNYNLKGGMFPPPCRRPLWNLLTSSSSVAINDPIIGDGTNQQEGSSYHVLLLHL